MEVIVEASASAASKLAARRVASLVRDKPDAVLGLAPPPVTGQDGRSALQLSLAIEQQIKDHVAHSRTTSA